MNPSDFKEDAPGHLVLTEQGDGHAFVPAALPPQGFAIDYSLATALSSADVALARLDGLARTLPDPEILARPFIRMEAVDSSRIEGTQTTYSDLVLFEAAQRATEPDTVVVANYLRALNHGIRRLAEIPLSRRLICEIHATLMRGYQENKSRPGEIRKGQVVIGAPNATPKTARFVPPPRTYLDDLLSDLEKFCNQYRDLPLLLRIAMVHYQFETIHPFWDGNGRVGRLLISLILSVEERLFRPMLYLSRYFEQHRREYYDSLYAVSTRAAWNEWFHFFLDGVATQANDAIARIHRLQDLRKTYEERLQSRKRLAASDLRLLSALFETPVTSIPMVRTQQRLSGPSAKDCIARLANAGILERFELPGLVHYWMAPEIIRAVQD